MNFEKLVTSVQNTNLHLQQNAIKAVNANLTLRNWLVGFYIVEFEQNGEDRAVYSSKLIHKLAGKIKIKGLSATNLKICRQFYFVYPEIFGTLSQEFRNLIPIEIRLTVSDEFQLTKKDVNLIGQTASDQLKNIDKNTDNLLDRKHITQLLMTVSFSHFIELIKIDDSTKRKFYELLTLKTTPSVKELQRQINTLSYERFGLSENKANAINELYTKIEPASTLDLVKSHYFFEFLNINQPHLVEERELEQALIQHLQEFMLELGNGFCFESRQKRILIGDEYFFIDLVFYHRILKCHILVELKTDKANHEHIGQLKTYINYYKKNMMHLHDNPPVGILLVTHQNKTLVEYAVADSDTALFVSEYLLQLPDKQEIANFIDNELKKP